MIEFEWSAYFEAAMGRTLTRLHWWTAKGYSTKTFASHQESVGRKNFIANSKGLLQ